MDDRLAALERAVATQDEAIRLLGDTVRALFFVNASLIAQLADSRDRDAVRTAALSALPDEADQPAAALVEMLTREPTEQVIEPDLPAALARLH